jgi:hypothetical protein
MLCSFPLRPLRPLREAFICKAQALPRSASSNLRISNLRDARLNQFPQ